MKVKAKLKNYRVSPRKVRLVLDVVRGQDVDVALYQLSHSSKKASVQLHKLLMSAIANAENNEGLDRDNLYVSDVQVGDGPTYKRWMPRAFGRATAIHKRTSNIVITLDERTEGDVKKPVKKRKKVSKASQKTSTKRKEKSHQGITGSKRVSAKSNMKAKATSGAHKAKMFKRKSV